MKLNFLVFLSFKEQSDSCFLGAQSVYLDVNINLKKGGIMISEKLQDAINCQIVAEMWSSNLYLSMSFYAKKEGFDGFASWLLKQSQEELQHAYDLADYLVKRGGVAKVDKIDVVPQEWESALALFEEVYRHECHVSSLIDELVNVAAAEKDKASQDFLWSYVREQVEEEATAKNIVDKIRMAGKEGLLFLDDKLGQRK